MTRQGFGFLAETNLLVIGQFMGERRKLGVFFGNLGRSGELSVGL
jgi:hypothetical protein